MDTNNTPNTGAGGSNKQPQEELRDELQAMGRAAADLLDHLVRVPAAIAQIPLQYLPEDTANHARNAATEGFKAVKTLIDSISSQVDEMMAQQSRRTGTQTGVDPTAPADATPEETTHMGHTHAADSNGTSAGEPTRRLDDEGE